MECKEYKKCKECKTMVTSCTFVSHSVYSLALLNS